MEILGTILKILGIIVLLGFASIVLYILYFMFLLRQISKAGTEQEKANLNKQILIYKDFILAK